MWGGKTGRFYQFLACTLWQVNTKRKKCKIAVFCGHSPLRDHRLFTGADGTDIPSLLTQQARAIPPLLKLCAPSHRNNDVVTSGASPIHNLKVTIVISAVLYRRQIRLLKSGVLVNTLSARKPHGAVAVFSRFFTEITKILALNVLTSTWVVVVFQARPI